MNKKVFFSLNLSLNTFQKKVSKGFNHFVYVNKEDFKANENERLINANQYRVKSTWFTFEKNTQILDNFLSKFNTFRFYKNVNLYSTYQKLLLWSNHKTGYLYYVKDKFYLNEISEINDKLFQYNITKTIFKYLAIKIKTLKKSKLNFEHHIYNKKIGIFIKSEFEDTLYQHLIKTGNFLIITSERDIYLKYKKIGLDSVLLDDFSLLKFPKIHLFFLRKEDWYVLNQIIRKWDEISKWFYYSSIIAKMKIEKLIINEGENGIFGSVMGEFMKQNNIQTFNTMNGAKCGEVQDSYISFDKWFVWDNEMKNMLIKKNGLNSNQLLVTGHLCFDTINQYQNNHTFSNLKEKVKDKIVVSLFSVRGKSDEKINVFNYLKNQLKENKDIFLVIKYHPSENESSHIIFEDNENVFINNLKSSKSKNNLFDQILLTDIAICFGSTVALECNWFGVPCITYEEREESLIYKTDNENLIHVQSLEMFKEKFNFFLKKKSMKRPILNSTSENILKVLNEY